MQILVATFAFDPAVGSQTACPNNEDYFPCTCYRSSSSNSLHMPQVVCINVTFAQVSNIFKQKTSTVLESFSLELNPADANTIVPTNLLNNHQAQNLHITCSNQNDYLMVDSQAFRSTQNTTKMVYFSVCDMSRLDFRFLTGFAELGSIKFWKMSKVGLANWATIPPLPNLDSFYITSSTGLNEWTTFPSKFITHQGLNTLSLYANEIEDETMDRILNWTLQHSANTLENLDISGNNVKKVPRQIPSFYKLKSIDLNGQRTGIPTFPRDSFLGIHSYHLDASSNEIVKIEDGAFQGKNVFT